MELSPMQEIHGFTVQEGEVLPEIDGTAYTLLHQASGAKLLYLQNDDDNKAFSIAFRTPPADDTGVFHILEHSVLCGSDKFPVKEPFVNLLKTSMQTFLNAMTFSDKTMYPVASTNDQDLMNLVDVYMDAVLHPAIYQHQEIFQQEGWHFELAEGEDGEGIDPSPSLTLNGVVYNEMKGALSDPSSVLYDKLQAALFPDTPYRFESGGMPQHIPDLTYQQFLAEHAQHYRLDNSYLVLYGNLNLDAMLGFLDREYLAAFKPQDGAAQPRTLPLQAPVETLGIKHDMATAPENACMGLGYVVGEVHERTRVIATDILVDALLGSNEAPLKRALLDQRLADDVQGFLADSMRQPFAVVQLRGLKEGASKRFRPCLEEAVASLLEQGIGADILEASISRSEFLMRERDYGLADGVALAMAALSGWLYGDDLATAYLKYEEDFAFLRGAIAQGYFDDLARSLFLENGHRAEVEIVPVDEAQGDKAEALRLADAQARFGDDDLQRVRDQVEALRAHQMQPDSPEALATLPQLRVSDIGAAPAVAPCRVQVQDGGSCIRHDIATRGITYVYRYFDLSHLTFDELPYVEVLALVLSKLDTVNYTASQLDTLVNGRLGNLSFFAEAFEDDADASALKPLFVVGSSALDEYAGYLTQLPVEIMLRTRFSDAEKIRDVLQQRRVGMEQSFANAGHSAALARATSYFKAAGMVQQQLSGVDFYRFLKDLLANFDERAPELCDRLEGIAKRLFTSENQTISFTGGDQQLAGFWQGEQLPQGKAQPPVLAVPEPTVRNEAFIVPTDVCYAAWGFDRRQLGTAFSGTWPVAGRILSYDYLWNEVRVKGGAYGAGFQAARTGSLRFYSYRDPHLDETLGRFGQAPEWLGAFDPSADEMDGYVVSSVAGFDTPRKPRALIRLQDGEWLTGHAPEERLAIREQMRTTTADDVRGLAPTIRQALDKGARCVFGSKEILAASTAGFHLVDLLNE